MVFLKLNDRNTTQCTDLTLEFVLISNQLKMYNLRVSELIKKWLDRIATLRENNNLFCKNCHNLMLTQ